MKYSLKINSQQFINGLKNTLRTHLNSAIHLAVIDIKRDLQLLIQNLLVASPEYQSILSGLLKSEFDLKNSQEVLNEILITLQRSILITTEPVRFDGIGLKASINVSIIKSDFSDLLALSGTSYESKNGQVRWLEWLLTRGDSIIILNTTIDYNLKSNSTKFTSGKGWRVPPEFAGTITSNWITRTFDINKVQKLVFDIMAKALQHNLGG